MRGEKIKNMECNENKEVSFSSFLAGALLVNSNVNMLYLSKCIHDFNVKTNIDVNDYGNDFSGLATIVTMNNDSISLNMDYTAQLIFNGNKILRIDIYYHLFDVFTTKEIFKIYCEILLENIYKSDQKLKDIKELTLIGKTQGDSYFYKINDNYDVTEILGEYEYNNIKYHIDYWTFKDIIMFNEKYKCCFEVDKNYKLQSLYLYDANGHRIKHPFLLHLAIKLFTGGELNEKDLAIGYEDQIFFHWDKSEI